MLKLKLKVVVAAVAVFTIAASGAGWKWASESSHRGSKHGATQPYRVAGWTWDESAPDSDAA
jgi:hypothetical protein